MKKILPLPFLMLMCGCSALSEIVDNGQAIIAGASESFVAAQVPQKIAAVVAAPSVVSVAELVLAGVAVLTGGAAGYVGVKKGKKIANGG
tara:strand:- start:887 stop:1156 length:270 start_codon:yes stop_codon:yes gene_type:complete